VQRLSYDLVDYDEIYLAYDEYYECYYVTDDVDKLCEEIHRKWTDAGCDNDPESEADSIEVWQYLPAKRKQDYLSIYKKCKPSLLNTNVPLIREKVKIGCEYYVDFIITR
jgi:hypothetical protein